MKIVSLLTKIFIIIGITILVIASSLFAYINRAIISNRALLLIILFLILSFMLAMLFIKSNIIKIDKNKLKWLNLIMTIISVILFIGIVLKSLVIDYFQPLTLSTLVSVLFIVGVITTLIPIIFNTIMCFLKGWEKTNLFIINILLILFMVTGIIWANTQRYRDFINIEGEKLLLYNNGEEGYNTFRIPSILAIDKDEINKSRPHSRHKKALCLFIPFKF